MKIDLHISNRQKCLPFLAVLYMAVWTCSGVLGNKLVLTYFGVISAASLVSPVWYILGDIITEVYAYRIARNLFWSVMICQLIFALTCHFLIKLDSPSYWHGQAGYFLVLGHLVRFSVVDFLGTIIAWHVNTKLLVKWKILMQGKHFWLRSIGSSGIGLMIYTILAVTGSVYNVVPHYDVFSIVLWSCLLKMLYLILLAYPATLVIALLASIENRNSIEESENAI